MTISAESLRLSPNGTPGAKRRTTAATRASNIDGASMMTDPTPCKWGMQVATRHRLRGAYGLQCNGVTASGVPLPELTQPAAVSLNGLRIAYGGQQRFRDGEASALVHAGQCFLHPMTSGCGRRRNDPGAPCGQTDSRKSSEACPLGIGNQSLIAAPPRAAFQARPRTPPPDRPACSWPHDHVREPAMKGPRQSGASVAPRDGAQR
jgi:hypothetical protein